ncbi:MAG: hypothetical protein DYH06_18785 [Acidobacteria bacterium ACB2]|nr:hypothetical protein [Acidobacteria bacterium ACB2]
MPNAQTYGELRKDLNKLLGQLHEVQGKAIAAEGRLEQLASDIATETDATELSGPHKQRSIGIDQMSASLSGAILPQEQWPC